MQTSIVLAQIACQEQFTCGSCTGLHGCGWCAPTQQCLPGNIDGPNNSTCIGTAWEFEGCTICDSLTDCRACLARDSDCFWCSNTDSCKNIGFTGCPVTHNCPCDIYSTCSDCVNDLTCKWCPNDGTCLVNVPESVCSSGNSDNFTTGCACSESKDCPTCRNNFGCNWCADGSCSDTCPGPIAFSCSLWCASVGPTCPECLAVTGCGWCKQTQSCLDPSTSSCLLAHTCPTCPVRTFCDTCLQDENCVWCSQQKSCEIKGTACLMAHTCESYCNGITSCDACNQLQGCVWCGDSKICADVSTATCFFAHTCVPDNGSSCGFNGGAFVGGMFLVIVLAGILGAGWAFYQWRSGARVHYTELK